MPVFSKGDKNVLFIHIPKTGGSTLETHFTHAGWKMTYQDGRMARDKPNYLRRCTPQHMHGTMLREMFRLERFDAVFAVVRDPLARFRSEYVMRNGESPALDARSVEDWADQALKRCGKNPFAFDNHMRPQHEFLVDAARVYRLEDGLEAALSDLNDRCGLDVPVEVGRVRTSEKTRGVSSSGVEISESLEQLLFDFYVEDFRTFGYRDVPSERRSVLARAAGRASRELASLAKRL